MADNHPTVTEVLDAWRQRGADRLDLVRFRFIEAMARRATAHEGEARRLLDERLGRLLAAHGAALEELEPPRKKMPPAAPAGGGLADLLAHVAERTGVARRRNAEAPPT